MLETIQNNTLWWTASKEKIAGEVFAVVGQLLDKQMSIFEDHKKHARLYGNYKGLGVRALDSAGLSYQPRISMNIVATAIDTAQSRIAKSKPRASFLTQQGDYGLKKQAEKLSKFIGGVYYDGNTYREARRSFVDAATFDLGVVKIVPKKRDKKLSLVHERVIGSEVVFDPSDARYGRPTQVFQIQLINRYTLADLYPSKKADILAAGKDFNYQHDLLSPDLFDVDSVTVIEGWKLPSATNKKGRHVMVINGASLVDEDWNVGCLPFEFMYYKDPMMGVYGEGVARRLVNLQLEINKLLRDIQLCMHLGAIPKVFVEDGSAVVSAHVNNEIGGIIKFRGKMPESRELMRVPPDLWQGVDQLRQIALNEVGLSELSVSGEKPAALQSGKALREYNDIEQDRFSIISQNYEDFHLGLWRKTVKMAKYYSLEDKSLSVLAPDKRGMIKLDWKDVTLDDDKYVLQAYPTSFLSKTPSGKLDDVSTLMEIGLIDAEDSLGLLEFPDLDSVYKVKNAEMDAVSSIIENIVDKDEYEAPTLRMSKLPQAIKKFTSMYYYYKNEGLEPEKLELLDRWVSEAMELMQQVEDEAMQADMQMQEQAALAQSAGEMGAGEQPMLSEQMPIEGEPTGVI